MFIIIHFTFLIIITTFRKMIIIYLLFIINFYITQFISLSEIENKYLLLFLEKL